MKIQKISANYQIKNNQQNFKGYVNGKYYEDWIIAEAKKALKDKNWEKLFRKERSSFQGYLKWHEAIEEQGGLTTRLLAGALTLGMSEALVGGLCAIGAACNNTNKDISKIKDCMIDLLKQDK